MPTPAKGVARDGTRRIVVTFDDETFAELAKIAADQNCSFAEVVRESCEWRLMEINEDLK